MVQHLVMPNHQQCVFIIIFHYNEATFLVSLLQSDWNPVWLPNNCPCGVKFSIKHALFCPKDGYIQSLDICDLTASLLTEVCHETQVEPCNHYAILNKEDEAHLNVSMNGFWGGRCEVFNPYAPTQIPPAIYHCHENTKKCTYTKFRWNREFYTSGMTDQAVVFQLSFVFRKEMNIMLLVQMLLVLFSLMISNPMFMFLLVDLTMRTHQLQLMLYNKKYTTNK